MGGSDQELVGQMLNGGEEAFAELPVHEDRLSEPVQADVLLGEEGLPRAIRFIGFRVR